MVNMTLYAMYILNYFSKFFLFVGEVCKLSNSLRSRAIQGALLFFLLIAFSLTAILCYHLRMNDKIQGLVNLGRLNDTISLLRQSEKSFFRYHNYQDYVDNAKSLDRCYKLFAALKNDISESGYSYEIIKTQFEHYIESMSGLLTLYGNEDAYIQKEIAQAKVNKLGNTIQDVAKKAFVYKNKSVNTYLFQLRLVMVLTFIAILLPSLFFACRISKTIVNPLKEIEKGVQKTGKGNFSEITAGNKSNIKEIQSLLDSLNKMSKEIQHRQEQLIYSKKLAFLGSIIPGIASKLDSPLSNISNPAYDLYEGIQDSDIMKKMELLRQILTNTDTAQDIVNSMLKFSWTEDLKMKLMNLKKCFAETLNSLKNNIPARIDLIVSIPDGIIIRADKRSFQQVFLNLISNAVHAIPEKENGEIIISARKNREKECIEIVVKDTGVGIEEEKLPHIFEPFFTTRKACIGLGLYIVHDIIELHSGSIKVKSKSGKGTTFIIYMPIGNVSYTYK